jgi:hypothetical protein
MTCLKVAACAPIYPYLATVRSGVSARERFLFRGMFGCADIAEMDGLPLTRR